MYRGVCAEFCGASHALMAFDVVVLGPADFARWLEAQQRPTTTGDDDGAALFVASGCGACHTVRGIGARGTIGPDLTHLASRKTIAAGTLPNTTDNLRLWLTYPDAVKPGAHMPSFGALPPSDLDALVTFLSELR
jgi:cytochrome c oxidase subunit 2